MPTTESPHLVGRLAGREAASALAAFGEVVDGEEARRLGLGRTRRSPANVRSLQLSSNGPLGAAELEHGAHV